MLKLQLALLCTFNFLILLFAGYAPAREWHAEMRVFAPQLVFMGAYFIYWGLMIANFSTAEDFYANAFPRFVTVSAAIMLAMGAWGCFHIKLMHESSGGFLADSPCGASSCSADTSSTATYNPNGFFKPHGSIYNDYQPTTCMYDDCTWGPSAQQLDAIIASSTVSGGALTKGYLPLEAEPGYPDLASTCDVSTGACLATNRSQDYPNPAVGIPGGFVSGFGQRVPTSDAAAICPGTRLVRSPANVLGALPGGGRILGIAPCSYCYPYFKKHYGALYAAQLAPMSYCPRSFAVDQTHPREDNDVWCGLVFGAFSYCPQPYETKSPHVMQRIVLYWYLVTTSPLLSILFIATQPRPGPDKSKAA